MLEAIRGTLEQFLKEPLKRLPRKLLGDFLTKSLEHQICLLATQYLFKQKHISLLLYAVVTLPLPRLYGPIEICLM